MNKNDTALKRYYRQIKGWLPCGGKISRRIMGSIRQNVEAYLEQYPEASFQQLQDHFGSPKAIASAYIHAQDPEEILSALRIRRRIVATVSAAAILVLLIWGAIVTHAAIEAANSSSYYIEYETK